jgi:hypothetical protein
MANSFMEYPEATGRTVEHVRYYNDPSAAPEVHVRFTDGTALSLKFYIPVKVESELYRMHEGDIQTLKRYPDA